MILKKVRANSDCVVTKINLSKNDGFRLCRLGIKKNQKLKILLNIAGGGVIVDVDGTCVAIGGEIAKGVEVEYL